MCLGAKVVQWCGHRLHVHPSFNLYLTTATPPSAISLNLRDSVSLISCDITIPVAQGLLADGFIKLLCSQEVMDRFKMACEGANSSRSQLKLLEEEIYQQLPSEATNKSYWLSTEKIKTTVAKMNEVHNIKHIAGEFDEDFRDL